MGGAGAGPYSARMSRAEATPDARIDTFIAAAKRRRTRAGKSAVPATLAEHGLARTADGTGEGAPARWFTPR